MGVAGWAALLCVPGWAQGLAAGENPFTHPAMVETRVSAEALQGGVGRLPKFATLAEWVEAPATTEISAKPGVPDPTLCCAKDGAPTVAIASSDGPPVLRRVESANVPGVSASSATTSTSVAVPAAVEMPTSSGGDAGAVARADMDVPTQVREIGKKARKLAAKYDVSRIGERGIGGGLNFYSIEKEVGLGRELAREIEAQVRLVKDEVITEYVNRIGQNIVRNSDAQVPFTIKVIDDEEINAFALPGGFFYVNSGLIMAAENEAELAGVMAHEIAHVAARHATKNATKSDLWNVLSIPLVFVGGPVGMVARNVANVALPMTMLKFGRNAERDADLLGIQYAYATGYDPAAMITFLEKVQSTEKKKPNFVARAFQSHPMNEDRIKRAQKVMGEYLPERDEYVLTTSEFDQVKARLAMFLGYRQIDEGKGMAPTLRRRTGEENAKDEPVKVGEKN